MNTLNKNQKIVLLTLVSILVIAVIIYQFVLPKINRVNTKDVPIYSTDTTQIEKTRRLLVPSDFPFPENIKNDIETQRTLNSFVDLNKRWESNDSAEKNIDLYVKYTVDNGWNPFVSQIGPQTTNISGQKDKVVINIFIEKVNTLESKVQVIFSQTK